MRSMPLVTMFISSNNKIKDEKVFFSVSIKGCHCRCWRLSKTSRLSSARAFTGAPRLLSSASSRCGGAELRASRIRHKQSYQWSESTLKRGICEPESNRTPACWHNFLPGKLNPHIVAFPCVSTFKPFPGRRQPGHLHNGHLVLNC